MIYNHRLLKTLGCAVLVLCLLLSAANALTLQECHQVKLTRKDTTQENNSVIREWIAATNLIDVDADLADIRQGYIDAYAPELQKAQNKTNKNSRLDVETRYSRTGVNWMSFLVQARITYHRELIGQDFTTRTYNMNTGRQIVMNDLFDEYSPGWNILADAIRTQTTAYFPDLTPDAAALDEICSREGMSDAEFTLHGMSIVLHYPAAKLYPGKHTLMEVTVFYPEIWDYMTEEAQLETDNLSYYKMAALTFDDGPSRTNTTMVLNNLMTCGARATFFVVGNLIDDAADLIQKEHDNGHAIGSHNWSHTDVRKTTASNMRAMPDKVNKSMINAIGIPVRYDRVPYGLYNQMIKAKVGWPLIQWSVDTYDWRGKSPSAVLTTVRKEIHDGAIILCHDIKEKTPDSATAICNWLAENGYMLLTIDELFAKDGVELQPDTVYFRCEDGVTTLKIR